jgi:prepilin-type N-terminal cleavage/methylation domain-containing protein
MCAPCVRAPVIDETHPERPSWRGVRGFTLVELMVVVILVGILAVMAIPQMTYANVEKRSYNDAITVSELFREARTRAMGRGSAEVIQMTSNGVADRGTFVLWEAQSTAAPGPPPGGILPIGSPMSMCGFPTSWPPTGLVCGGAVAGQTATCIDGVNLNGSIEAIDGITTTINGANLAGGITPINAASICFTPLGRTYWFPLPGVPAFIPGSPMVGELQIALTHTYPGDASGLKVGITRTIVVPNSGATRIFSR